MIKKKVILGISGGIDSAASVLLLKQQGFLVVGVYLQMTSVIPDIDNLEQTLGIDIIVKDVRLLFKSCILDNFVSEYLEGRTPSPCVECNYLVKWKMLREIALENDAQNWATGHYCRTQKTDGKYYVRRGVDELKDQSYYLWKLDQDILNGALFPLGEYTKDQVYELMGNKGYQVFVKKKQSMGICFLLGQNLKDYLLENSADGVIKPGKIVDANGLEVGNHKGFPLYTIAQKKGMGLPKGECVVDIVPSENQLIVGTRDSLYITQIEIINYSFVDIEKIKECENLKMIVRGVGENPEDFVKLYFISETEAIACLDNPAWAVTRGQPVVFYIDDLVVGGAYIK